MKKSMFTGILVLILASCQFSDTLVSDKALSKKIETAFTQDREKVDLSQLNDLEWDEVLILGPYSVIDQTGKELKLDLSNIEENRIEYSDTFNLLIFIKDGESIKISEVSRKIGDFTNIGIRIAKNDAIFNKTESGKNTLVN